MCARYVRNHYIPKCYSKRWTDENGEFFLVNKKDLSYKKVTPTSVFFEKRLYQTSSLYPDFPQYFEPEFFTKVDTEFSRILDLLNSLELGKIESLSPKEKIFICNFCLLLFFRTPSSLKRLLDHIKASPYSKEFHSDKEIAEHIIWYLAKTFDKSCLTSEFLLGQDWYIASSRNDFVFSENPIFWTGINQPCEYSFMFPIAPYKAIVFGLYHKKSRDNELCCDDVNFYNMTAISTFPIIVAHSEKTAKFIKEKWEAAKSLEERGFKKNQYGFYVKD